MLPYLTQNGFGVLPVFLQYAEASY